MIYLASPYTHPDTTIELQRFKDIARISLYLLSHGIYNLSPILHCHPIREHCLTPGDYNFWQQWNHAAIQACTEGFCIAKLDGWENSKGINGELGFALSIGRQVVYLDPVTYAISKQP